MDICNIFSIKNQQHYKNERVVMILAHLLDKYDWSCFDFKHQYVIMDNGLWEKQQVSTNLEDLIKLTESKGIEVDEFVVPDVMFDYEANIKMFEDNLKTIEKYNNKYNFMVVAHHKNFGEFKKFFEYIKQYENEYGLTVAIPKCSVFNRTSKEAKEVYQTTSFPIHFLGMKSKERFRDLLKVNALVRSCDTSLLSIIIKYHVGIDDYNVMEYVRGDNESVDLAIDKVDDYHLGLLLKDLRERF